MRKRKWRVYRLRRDSYYTRHCAAHALSCYTCEVVEKRKWYEELRR